MVADAGNGRGFVGRVETVQALRRRFEDAQAGHGGFTLVVGDTGVGKTELIRDLVRTIRQRGVQVLEGRAPPLDAPPPFALIRSAIESARAGDEDAGPDGLGFIPERVLIGFAPRLDDALVSSPVHVEQRLLDALQSVDHREEGGHLTLLDGIAAQFVQFTRRGPTVLILEDLHRADESSLAALEFLARQFQERPLWIVATTRSPAALPDARRVRLESLAETTRAERLELRPLTSAEVGEYLRRARPERPVSPEEITRWHSETGGNPLLLEQFERRLAVGDASSPSLRREAGAPIVPPTLDEEEERVVATAAVAGPECSFQLLLRSTGEEEERLAELVDRLVGAGVLLERPAEALAFADDRVRERVYEGLTESRRRLLHQRVGEALEATGTADVPTVYALARHYHLGKVDDRSISYNRMAAEIAIRAHAPEVAIEHLTRALESHRRLAPDDWEGETELVVELAQQVDLVGRLKEAEEMLRTHLARQGLRKRLSPSVLALTELYLARLLTDQGEWHAAERTIQGVLGAVGPEGLQEHPTVLIALHRLRGEVFYYAGRYADALAEHSEELRLADESGDELARATGEVRRANVLGMMGRGDSAAQDARHAAETLERLGDLSEAAHARLFLGVILAGIPGDPPRHTEAIQELAEAIRLAEQAHDLRREGWALFNTADILRELGRHEEAVQRNARSREILERIGDRFGLVNSMIVAGKLLIDRGEFDRAEVELLDAYRLARELKADADEVDVVLRLAQLSYARGDRASASRRVVELTRRHLPDLRPDLAHEFENLKNAVRTKEPPRGRTP